MASVKVLGPRGKRSGSYRRGEEPPAAEADLDPIAQATLRRLLSVWLTFERELDNVPVFRKLRTQRFTVEDYRRILVNLRQQVVEGSRWIARAASSFDDQYLEVRSMVLGHAKEEHRDYELLESDYIKAGGNLAEIRSTPKNVGSEALHGYLMYQASLPNPLQLLGAMFIIEGLGQKMARSWASAIAEQTGVGPKGTRFLAYHAENDDSHLDKLHNMLALPEITDAISEQVVKTAKVVARLYRLQLEELDVR